MTDYYSQKKRRILHIVGDSKYGGGALIILRLSEMAKKRGWDVDILTSEPVFQEVLKKSQIGVIDIDVIRRDISPIRDILGLYRLVRFLRANRYDIIHTHTSKAGIIGRLAARLSSCPSVIHTAHGFAFHEESAPLVVKVYSCFERIAAGWCQRIVTVSEFHRRWALQLKIGNEIKVVAVPNGIPESRVVPDKSKMQTRESLGITPEELMILSNGRLAPQKGLEYLIQSVIMLKQKLKQQFKIVLAGDGLFRSQLEQLAMQLNVSEYVMFLGFTHEINNLLSACDIVILPSLREGLSIALLEAMAAGKPIITTSIGSNREVTRDGEAAVLVRPKDPEGIADAILKLSNDKELSRNISAKARDLFVACYTEERMLSQYSDIYLSLLNCKAGFR